MNKNSAWRYLLLLVLVTFGVIYASPNLYQADAGVQIIGLRDISVDEQLLARVDRKLKSENLSMTAAKLEENKIKITFDNKENQQKAKDILKGELGGDYGVALADVSTTPSLLSGFGAAPMYLGLDLRGGVHFLLQVDMQAAQEKTEDNYVDDIKKLLQDKNIRYTSVRRIASGVIQSRFSDEDKRNRAQQLAVSNFPQLEASRSQQGGRFMASFNLSEAAVSELKKAALNKNMQSIRNRIDQLGVSEPIVQQQGADRIVVQLPGVQDPAEAKNILGKTATIEVKLVDEENDLQSSINGRVPVGSRRYFYRDGNPILLQQRLLFSGDNIVDASSGFDSQSGGAVVHIALDAKGGAVNRKVTGENIKKRMAVIYKETKAETSVDAAGEQVIKTSNIEEVLTAPVIQSQLGKRFMITGLGSPKEAQDLALLLRAGALATPVYIVEERTVGPSLGKENIQKGFNSVLWGFMAVLVFMVIYYRVFGMVASFALVLNLVIIVAVLSLLQATLTLPGVAGMVLTVGMAVDANVLIFERIREELKNSSSPQLAIHTGYNNAFSTIIDANLTTLIAALVLFNFGTGPIQGFAITLSIGIATSMITAIFVSRVLVNFVYGGRRIESLSI